MCNFQKKSLFNRIEPRYAFRSSVLLNHFRSTVRPKVEFCGNANNFGSGTKRSRSSRSPYLKKLEILPRMLSPGRPQRSAAGATHSLAPHGSSSRRWPSVATGKESLLDLFALFLTDPLSFSFCLLLIAVRSSSSLSFALSLDRHCGTPQRRFMARRKTVHGRRKNNSSKDTQEEFVLLSCG